MGIVEVKDLNKRYPAFQLKDVSFSIRQGRITGFIGRNGAGKTTTIKSVLNLVHPDSGEINYFGMPLIGNEAEILILDEPTSGLDPFSRDELLSVFTELKEQGTCIFFSTHITSDLEKCADDIVYISNGKIVSEMPKDEFMAEHSDEGESLEDAILRMERSIKNA